MQANMEATKRYTQYVVTNTVELDMITAPVKQSSFKTRKTVSKTFLSKHNSLSPSITILSILKKLHLRWEKSIEINVF